jgi:hypothetical protein
VNCSFNASARSTSGRQAVASNGRRSLAGRSMSIIIDLTILFPALVPGCPSGCTEIPSPVRPMATCAANNFITAATGSATDHSQKMSASGLFEPLGQQAHKDIKRQTPRKFGALHLASTREKRSTQP